MKNYEMSPDNLVKGGAVICFLFALFVVTSLWFQAYMEAATYNKLTGSNATAWDALWVEFRITPSEK